MAKDDPGGLLSKVVRFVRNPATNWSDLDEAESVGDSGNSRQMLKELVERKKRNDFVRKREFEMLRKLRRGVWTIQAQLDLHGLRSDEAREALGQFVRDAKRMGWRCVRVVHGKGLGSPGKEPVLKSKVQRWLVQKNEVLAFVQAKPSDGGAGALVVLLGPSNV